MKKRSSFRSARSDEARVPRGSPCLKTFLIPFHGKSVIPRCSSPRVARPPRPPPHWGRSCECEQGLISLYGGAPPVRIQVGANQVMKVNEPNRSQTARSTCPKTPKTTFCMGDGCVRISARSQFNSGHDRHQVKTRPKSVACGATTDFEPSS